MRRGIHVQMVLATLLLSVLVLLIPMSVRAVNVGDKAPDFLAFDTVGESTRLSDFQGKKTVLMFFFVRAFGGV
jgi:cytochrome oxidase Cu insertion factor (SCO1/SenC/PrrC family)